MKVGDVDVINLYYRGKPIAAAYVGSVQVWPANSDKVFAGQLIAASLMAGDVVVLRAMTGEILCASVFAGSMSRLVTFAGSMASVSTFAGDVAVTNDVIFEGSFDGLSNLSAELAALRALAGSMVSQSIIAGTLERNVGLAGAIDALSAFSGSMQRSVSLAGTIAAVSAMSAAMTVESPAQITYVTTIDNNGDLSVYDFADANIGGPGLIVVGFQWEATANRSLSSAMIGGAAASVIQNGGGVEATAALFALRVAAGTTASLQATLTGSAIRSSASIWRITNNLSDTPTASNQSATNSAVTSRQVDLNILKGGVAVAALGLNAPSPVTWTGATERFDAAVETNSQKSGADYRNTTGADEAVHSIIASFSSTNGGMSAASWR